MFKIFMFLFLFAFAHCFGEEIERRAVFFFASDKIEVYVADVDEKEQKVIQQLFSEIEKFTFNDDLWREPRKSSFSKKTQDETVRIVKKLMKKAETFKPQIQQGFAGEFFHKVKNAQDLAKKINDEAGLNVLILSEEQEGVVEFIATVNKMQINPAKAVTWNIGWNFMRLTAQCGENYFV